jgi:hypothetical protein
MYLDFAPAKLASLVGIGSAVGLRYFTMGVRDDAWRVSLYGAR